MTIAAAIEIGSGGTPTIGSEGARAPRQDRAQSAASGSGQFTLANQAFFEPNASSAGSFRAGWQSLLASMGPGAEGFRQTEALKNQEDTSAQRVPVEEAGKSSAATLPETGGANSVAKQQSGKGTEAASAVLTLQAHARAAFAAARSVADAKKTAASSTEEKTATANVKSTSAGNSRSSHSAVPEVAAVGQLLGLVTLPVAAIPQAVSVAHPVPLDTDTLTQPAGEKAQAGTLRDLFVDRPAGPVRASSSSYSHNPDLIKGADEGANTTAQEAANKLEEPQKQGAAARGALDPGSADQAEISADKSSASMTKPLAASSAMPGMSIPGQSETPIQPGANALSAAIDNDRLNAVPAVASANVSRSGQLSAVPQIEGGPGPAGEKKGSASGALRSPHETGNADSVQHGNHIMPVESFVSAAGGSAALHTITGAGGVASTTGELTARTTAATTGPDSREAFASLDAGEATGKPTWIHAGSQRVEAGFQDPVLGWVGVRADTSGGGVHAELVAGSADAAQTLGGHLPGLNAYLAEHQTQVQTLTLSSQESGWTALGSGSGPGGGMQQGTGDQQTGQETAQGIDSGAHSASPVAPEPQARFAGQDTSAQTTRLSGHHISVVA